MRAATEDSLSPLDTAKRAAAEKRTLIGTPANLEAMASRLPDSKLEFFDGGHLFLMQDRRAFSALVAFLKG